MQDSSTRMAAFIAVSFAGKSRFAHTKQMTIPRLELSAAGLAVRMNQTLQEEFQLTFDRTTLWTDSTAVLQYTKNKDKRFYTFVANRLAVIHDGSELSRWNYVPTNINPADDVSRGLTMKELLSNEALHFCVKISHHGPLTRSP